MQESSAARDMPSAYKSASNGWQMGDAPNTDGNRIGSFHHAKNSSQNKNERIGVYPTPPHVGCRPGRPF
jgi:hypothetical protein